MQSGPILTEGPFPTELDLQKAFVGHPGCVLGSHTSRLLTNLGELLLDFEHFSRCLPNRYEPCLLVPLGTGIKTAVFERFVVADVATVPGCEESRLVSHRYCSRLVTGLTQATTEACVVLVAQGDHSADGTRIRFIAPCRFDPLDIWDISASAARRKSRAARRKSSSAIGSSVTRRLPHLGPRPAVLSGSAV